MLGAIIGDIVGSRFEWNNIKTKDFDFFCEDCSFTDDSVMSIAVAKALIECRGDYQELSDKAVKAMRLLGNRYPDAGYGGFFYQWLTHDNFGPYQSYGNGAAMRVSACGFIAKSLKEAKALAYQVTSVTHDHPEGIKGAEATAVAIYLAKSGSSKEEIKEYIANHYYNLGFTLESIRPIYGFDVSCQGSVPQAIVAFLEADSFEDTIRNAISIGGDSDTLAAIAGGIAEAYYGIDETIKKQARKYLTSDLLEIIDEFESLQK